MNWRRLREKTGFFKKIKALSVFLVVLAYFQITTLISMGRTPATGATYRFVQMENGYTVEAQSIPGSQRSDAVISRFAGDLVTLGYRWDRTKKDAQYNGVFYPASYRMSSRLIRGKARDRWLLTYYYKYGPGMGNSKQGVNRRDLNYHAVLTQTPVITATKPGIWNVEVKGVRLVTSPDNSIVGREKIGFNFTIEAINPNPNSTWDLTDPELAPYMERFWSDGLAVTDFVDLEAGM